jgi:hypothetical protein
VPWPSRRALVAVAIGLGRRVVEPVTGSIAWARSDAGLGDHGVRRRVGALLGRRRDAIGPGSARW